MPTGNEHRNQSNLLLPMSIASAVLIALMPILHPYGTCADWLQNWGMLYLQMKSWIHIHQIGMVVIGLKGI